MNYFKLMSVLLVCGTVSCVAVNKNTGASWSFDSMKNVTIKDSVGTNNAVGSKNLVKKNLLQEGLYGKAIKMEKGQNMLTVKHNENLSLIDSFTIKCVFKSKKINSYRTLVWKGSRRVKPEKINYYVSTFHGKLEFKFKNAKGTWFVFSSEKIIEAGKWYHAVITFDNGKITGYVNGKKVMQGIYKPGKLCPNKYPVYIGAGQDHYSGGIGYSFDGLIDELSITKGIHPPKENEIKKFSKLNKNYESLKLSIQAEIKKKLISEIIKNKVYGSKFTRNQLLNMSQGKFNKLYEKCRYHNFFSSIAQNKSFAATTIKTANRIVSPESLINSKIKFNKDAKLFAAKNEYEGFQIILLGNPERDTKDIKIQLNSLTSENGKQISKDQIEWGYIKTIRADRPQYAVDFTGEIPEVIMEGQASKVKVKAGWFTPVYVRIRVKDSVPSGVYKGNINISCKGERSNVNISLKVYDFKLPVKTSLKIAFSFFENFYKKWYGYKGLNDQQKMYIYDFLLKYRITPNNIYSKGIYPELRFMPELKKKGATFCTLGYLIKHKKLSEQELDKTMDIYRKRIEKVNKAGFGDMTYLYAFDELKGCLGNIEVASQVMTRFRKEFPKIKTIQTSFPKKDILKFFDVWSPLFNYFATNLKEIQALEKKDNEFWWYCADSPHKPYPNFFLDYPVFDNRIIMTLSYMYNVKGVLYWCINREWSTNFDIKKQWPGKRWKPYIINCFTNKRQHKNGMGNYVYPGKDGKILPSLRLENLRDGIEDYEYLMILKKRVAAAKAKRGNAALVKQAEKLLKVPANVAVTVADYSANPEHLLKYRKQLAEMIVKLNK